MLYRIHPYTVYHIPHCQRHPKSKSIWLVIYHSIYIPIYIYIYSHIYIPIYIYIPIISQFSSPMLAILLRSTAAPPDGWQPNLLWIQDCALGLLQLSSVANHQAIEVQLPKQGQPNAIEDKPRITCQTELEIWIGHGFQYTMQLCNIVCWLVLAPN